MATVCEIITRIDMDDSRAQRRIRALKPFAFLIGLIPFGAKLACWWVARGVKCTLTSE